MRWLFREMRLLPKQSSRGTCLPPSRRARTCPLPSHCLPSWTLENDTTLNYVSWFFLIWSTKTHDVVLGVSLDSGRSTSAMWEAIAKIAAMWRLLRSDSDIIPSSGINEKVDDTSSCSRSILWVKPKTEKLSGKSDLWSGNWRCIKELIRETEVSSHERVQNFST